MPHRSAAVLGFLLIPALSAAQTPLDGFDPLPGSPEAPARARGEDLWFVVDPRRLEITVLRGGVAQ